MREFVTGVDERTVSCWPLAETFNARTERKEQRGPRQSKANKSDDVNRPHTHTSAATKEIPARLVLSFSTVGCRLMKGENITVGSHPAILV